MIDLSKSKTWLALPIIGVIVGQEITIGNNDEIKFIRLSQPEEDDQTLLSGLSEKLIESFQSWEVDSSNNLLLNKPQLLLIPIVNLSPDTIRNALIYSDLALTLLYKKSYGFGLPQFVQWDRRYGSAVGAVYNNTAWEPLLRPSKIPTPVIRELAKDDWDELLSKLLQAQLNNEVEQALLANLEWEREALMSPHDTHRFAFEWVALESGMINGERGEGDFVRRLGLLAAAPRGADSQIIRGNPATKAIFDNNPNPHSNIWVRSIKEMYHYRCNILHDGATEATAISIEPLKVDWFYHIAKHLNTRLQKLLQCAILNNVSTLKDMWDSYAVNFMYSPGNQWVEGGTQRFIGERLITFDWLKGRFPY